MKNSLLFIFIIFCNFSFALPFVDVLTENTNVSYNVSDFYIQGTNNDDVVGYIFVSNVFDIAFSTNFPATNVWTTKVELMEGSNFFYFIGTNSLCVTNDFVSIFRESFFPPLPNIEITNYPNFVNADISDTNISGSCTNIIGNLAWVLNQNAQTNWNIIPSNGTWNVSITGLINGTNNVEIIGTNAFSMISKNVEIFREENQSRGTDFETDDGYNIEIIYNGKKGNKNKNQLNEVGVEIINKNIIKINEGKKKNKLQIFAKNDDNEIRTSSRAYSIISEKPIHKLKLAGVKLQEIIIPPLASDSKEKIDSLEFIQSGFYSDITISGNVSKIYLKNTSLNTNLTVWGNVSKFFIEEKSIEGKLAIYGSLKSFKSKSVDGINNIFVQGAAKKFVLDFYDFSSGISGLIDIAFENSESSKWKPSFIIKNGNLTGAIKVNSDLNTVNFLGGYLDGKIFAAGEIKKIYLKPDKDGDFGNFNSSNVFIRSGFYTNSVLESTSKKNIGKIICQNCFGAKFIADSSQNTNGNWNCYGGSIGSVKKRGNSFYGSLVTKEEIKNIDKNITDTDKTVYIVDGIIKKFN